MRFVTITLHAAVDRIVAVPALVPGGLNDARLLAELPAGKGVNAARTLKAAGGDPAQVVALAWTGSDRATWFRRSLRDLGVRPVIVARPAATRVCLTVLEADGRETHLRETSAPPGPADEATLRAALARLPTRDAAVALCGSAPPGTSRLSLDAALDALARGRLAVADVAGPLLVAAARRGLHGIKGNAVEIGAWLGAGTFDPSDPGHLAALRDRIAAPRGPASILVTLGPRGGILADRTGAWLATPPDLGAARIGPATAAGDAATAGWLHALARGLAAPDALRRAVAWGTARLTVLDPALLQPRAVADVEAAVRVTTR
jgi:fructose-1-phosphate kinase PfkB-like protein